MIGLLVGMDGERRVAPGVYENSVRDFTKFLNEDGWSTLVRKLSSIRRVEGEVPDVYS